MTVRQHGQSAASTPSLFVLALPRSLSTTIYTAAAGSLSLKQPGWVTGGEILNADRAKRLRHPDIPPDRYVTHGDSEGVFRRLTDLLDAAACPRDFAYKDVVNPFVVTDWAQLSRFRVLKVHRDVAEVAFTMIERGWDYPIRAATRCREPKAALAEGLLRAEHAIGAVPGITLAYDDAVADCTVLLEALRRLYPDAEPVPIDYIGRRFARGRRIRLQRLSSTGFTRMLSLTDTVRGALHSELRLSSNPASQR